MLCLDNIYLAGFGLYIMAFNFVGFFFIFLCFMERKRENKEERGRSERLANNTIAIIYIYKPIIYNWNIMINSI